jgi:voltage-gated potassium channel
VENRSLGNGIYWAVTTMTTVGYGDITPKTPEGKIMAITVMLIGIGFATLVIGAIAERFINRPVHEVELTEADLLEQVRDISARLQRLERALEQRRADG